MPRRWLAALALVGLLWVVRLAAEDWDFTPDDYEDLIDDGSDLQFDDDSNWVPQDIKDNLRATLKKLLDPKTQPPMTDGINVKDFYHGHVVCPRPCAEELITAIRAKQKLNEDGEGEALGGGWWDRVTDDNLKRFIDAKRRGEIRSRAQLDFYATTP